MNLSVRTLGLRARQSILPIVDVAVDALARIPGVNDAITALASTSRVDHAIARFGQTPLGHLGNRLVINTLAHATPARPCPYSLFSAVDPGPDGFGPVSDYTSWPGLTDRSFSGRHLAPASQAYVDGLPYDKPWTELDSGDITRLFQRRGEMKPARSSMLFMFFAQWFTDSFLRVDPTDRRRNTSNHEIDLCQIYGLTESTARILRAHQGGRLKSQILHGEEYPDYLYTESNGQWRVKDEYQELPYVKDGRLEVMLTGFPEDRRHKLYATGLERGNSSVGYVAMSILFLREHNRIAKVLSELNPRWDDERLFQTARLINTAIILKIVVEEYINHIAGAPLFHVDVGFAEREPWYRTNRMSLEFNLLYRWHGLVPDRITLAGNTYAQAEFRTHNRLLEEVGVATVLRESSLQAAGRIGLKNTPNFLLGAEYMSIKMGREFRLRPFNEYREQFSLRRLRDFDELTSDVAVQNELRALYKSIDNLEFVVGLFAEEPRFGALFGELITVMVACDAFSQALTNPVLSRHIFNANTLTDYGFQLVSQTNSLQHLVDRNVAGSGLKVGFGYPPSAVSSSLIS